MSVQSGSIFIVIFIPHPLKRRFIRVVVKAPFQICHQALGGSVIRFGRITCQGIRRRLAEMEPEPWPLPDLSSPRPAGIAWDVAIIGAGVAGLAAAALSAYVLRTYGDWVIVPNMP